MSKKSKAWHEAHARATALRDARGDAKMLAKAQQWQEKIPRLFDSAVTVRRCVADVIFLGLHEGLSESTVNRYITAARKMMAEGASEGTALAVEEARWRDDVRLLTLAQPDRYGLEELIELRRMLQPVRDRLMTLWTQEHGDDLSAGWEDTQPPE